MRVIKIGLVLLTAALLLPAAASAQRVDGVFEWDDRQDATVDGLVQVEDDVFNASITADTSTCDITASSPLPTSARANRNGKSARVQQNREALVTVTTTCATCTCNPANNGPCTSTPDKCNVRGNMSKCGGGTCAGGNGNSRANCRFRFGDDLTNMIGQQHTSEDLSECTSALAGKSANLNSKKNGENLKLRSRSNKGAVTELVTGP